MYDRSMNPNNKLRGEPEGGQPFSIIIRYKRRVLTVASAADSSKQNRSRSRL